MYGNSITNNTWSGVYIFGSFDNTFSGNDIRDNGITGWGSDAGVKLYNTSGNIISKNNLTNNGNGINLNGASSNFICHNNFIDNTPVSKTRREGVSSSVEYLKVGKNI